ncbi:hypothetical protein BKA70DRAFT_1433358 [Coprinopsis sp. MPI-PUGE-AT-0042]|nr:hypothetical protein BKA70DRAFT_1433358 [Coprinopsis sp. MPI-PUGE-AT-0042]
MPPRRSKASSPAPPPIIDLDSDGEIVDNDVEPGPPATPASVKKATPKKKAVPSTRRVTRTSKAVKTPEIVDDDDYPEDDAPAELAPSPPLPDPVTPSSGKRAAKRRAPASSPQAETSVKTSPRSESLTKKAHVAPAVANDP